MGCIYVEVMQLTIDSQYGTIMGIQATVKNGYK